MLIPTIYLIIAGQVAIIMVFLIAYLIYMLVAEENRWEDYSDKLKSKIRKLQEYKERFDIVSEHLHKQIKITKELKEKAEQFDSELNTKNETIAEHENLINELQITITDLQNLIKNLEEKENQLEDSKLTVTELKTQLALLEDQGAELPKQINGLNITIESLETENNTLKVELNTANDSIVEYEQAAIEYDKNNLSNDNFNISMDGSKPISDNQIDLLNNLKARYQGEMGRLKKNYNNQKNIIDDLEMSLMDARNNPSKAVDIDVNGIIKIKQMLAESNTIVEMLEGEIDTLQLEVDKLMAHNKALTESTSNSSHTGNDQLDTDRDTDDVIVNVDASADDVFFDVDESANNNEQSPANDSAEFEQLKAQLDGANKMAMTMMMTSGDQGNIINFARNSIHFESLEDLGKGVLATVALFQVNGALQLRGEEHDALNLSTFGQLSKIDIDKITHEKGENVERFVENGAKLLIQFDSISLLIKDMPLDDNDKMGRIKDNMAIALELASSNLSSIEASLKIKKNQKILNQVLKNTYETIQNVEKQFNEQNEVTNQVINSLTGIISNPAMTEGMDPIYKDVFTSIINDGKGKFDEIKEAGVAIDGNFSDIVRRLGSKIDE